jgi:hypothetical protein
MEPSVILVVDDERSENTVHHAFRKAIKREPNVFVCQAGKKLIAPGGHHEICLVLLDSDAGGMTVLIAAIIHRKALLITTCNASRSSWSQSSTIAHIAQRSVLASRLHAKP